MCRIGTGDGGAGMSQGRARVEVESAYIQSVRRAWIGFFEARSARSTAFSITAVDLGYNLKADAQWGNLALFNGMRKPARVCIT